MDEKDRDEDRDDLEALVDKYRMSEVLEMLEEIADLKADRDADMNNPAREQSWEMLSEKIEQASSDAKELGL